MFKMEKVMSWKDEVAAIASGLRARFPAIEQSAEFRLASQNDAAVKGEMQKLRDKIRELIAKNISSPSGSLDRQINALSKDEDALNARRAEISRVYNEQLAAVGERHRGLVAAPTRDVVKAIVDGLDAVDVLVEVLVEANRECTKVGIDANKQMRIAVNLQQALREYRAFLAALPEA